MSSDLSRVPFGYVCSVVLSFMKNPATNTNICFWRGVGHVLTPVFGQDLVISNSRFCVNVNTQPLVLTAGFIMTACKVCKVPSANTLSLV